MKKPYTFQPKDSLRENATRVATFLNEEFNRQLSYKSNVHESIHNARLCMKRQRALLRLIRPAIGEKVYRAENDFHRDTARKLAFLRDHTACLDAVKALKKNRRSDYLGEQMEGLYKRIYGLRSKVLAKTETTMLFGGLSRSMLMAKDRIAEWDLSMPAEEIINQGIFRLYRQGHSRFSEALQDPGEVTFHQLRKSTKYLMYFYQMLMELWPPVMKVHSDELKQLSSATGTHHDIYVFEHNFDRMIPPDADRQYRSRLRQAIWKKKKKLEPLILEQSARIYAEDPVNYGERFKVLWSKGHFPVKSL